MAMPMLLWLDNTGFNSAEISLAGYADKDVHIEGLLQLATFVVFADRILVNEFEDDSVVRKTVSVRDELRWLGATKEEIDVEPVTRTEYGQACLKAAAKGAEELLCAFDPEISAAEGLSPKGLGRSLIVAKETLLKSIVSRDGRVSVPSDWAGALEYKAPGAVQYMLASCEELRCATERLLRLHPQWIDTAGRAYDAFLRSYLNYALAESRGAEYAPAVARARIVRVENKKIVRSLSKMLDKVVAQIREDLQEKPLCVPAVAVALEKMSKGDARGVLAKAIDLRSKAKGLRRRLAAAVKRSTRQGGDPDAIEHETDELGTFLRKELGLQPGAHLDDALGTIKEIGMSAEIGPDGTVSGGLKASLDRSSTLPEWVRFRWNRGRVAVLSEISRKAAHWESSDYEHLRQNCMRNAL
jgi:hypothetical protein